MGHPTPVSFEVYPPKTPDGLPALHEAIRALDGVDPGFISVTFGASGSSTRDSLEVLRFIRDHTQANPLAHLTCVGTTRTQVEDLIHTFVAEGINDFLALRGDLPEGQSEHHGELDHASDLVELMVELRSDGRGPERIAVAAFPNGHPESATRARDIETLLIKQDAGAQLAITQLFFYSADYERFVTEAQSAGVTIPILPGLMPSLSPARLARVLELSGESRPVEHCPYGSLGVGASPAVANANPTAIPGVSARVPIPSAAYSHAAPSPGFTHRPQNANPGGISTQVSRYGSSPGTSSGSVAEG